LESEVGGIYMRANNFADDPSLVLEFIAESLEHLDGIDNNLFEYERNPDDAELIDSIFRAIHSVKGSSGFLGLDEINKLAHRLETLLDELRKGKRSPNADVMDVLFSGCDLLRTLIEEISQQLDKEMELDIEHREDQLASIMSTLNQLIDSSEQNRGKTKAKKDKSSAKKKAGGYEISKEMLRDFQLESLEHLETCDAALIELDKNRKDKEAINNFFRAIHTIKGTAAYVGQEEISSLSHALEFVLELVRRKDACKISDKVLDLAFQTVDALRTMVNDLEDENARETAKELKDKLVTVKKEMEKEADNESKDHEEEPSSTDPLGIFKNAATQHIDTTRTCVARIEEKKGFEAPEVDMLFRAAHSLKSSANYMGFESIVKECSVLEELLDDIKKGDMPFGAAIVDMMNDTIDSIEKELGSVAAADMRDGEGPDGTGRDKGEESSKRKHTTNSEVQQKSGKETKVPTSAQVPKTMRIDQSLLDVFMNLVGELIVSRNALGHVQRQLTQGEVQLGEAIKGLQKATQTITRISDEMQRSVMEMRMVPVRNVFQKFPRIVRDISRKTGKKVDLIFQGEDTEIDKAIAEDIGDPLVHIIRNSMDHGIEAPEVRVKKGKPETGTIILKAYHEGNYIIIDVIDDGAGINPDAVLNKAIENGMISQSQAEGMSKEEIFNLIFMPGFSTAKEVTDISGRGVGMDVVRTNLAKLKGNVRVTSEINQGTHVRLEVPLTLALVEAMLVGAGGNTYAIPVESIKETLKISASDVNTLMKKKAITHRGKVIGLELLSHLLNISRNGDGVKGNGEMPVLIIQAANETMGIAVEKLYRKEEIVIKPLADYLAGLPGIAGASILGDGQTILILEPNELISMGTEN